MERYRAEKGTALIHIVLITILFDIAIIALSIIINTYILSTFLKVFMVAFNVYQVYYILLSKTLNYTIQESTIEIKAIFGIKKIKIFIDDILDYCVKHQNIEGVKLTGYNTKKFALGRFVIKDIGTSRMFVTSNKDVVYLKTKDRWYGISPENIKQFEKMLRQKVNITEKDKEIVKVHPNIYKDKNFIIPFIIVSILIVGYTLNPFILYLKDSYVTAKIPMAFNTYFQPTKWGTPKQFAFKQMAYGALNMGILFCVYYISYFYAKYDKKVSYKFVYIEFAIIVLFIVLQIRILRIFNVASVITIFKGMI